MHLHPTSRFLRWMLVAQCFLLVAAPSRATVDFPAALKEYCFDCHGEGSKKGGVSLDADSSDKEATRNKWFAVWLNLDAELMPPPDKPRPSAAERAQLQRWVAESALHLDLQNPDPGKVTIRRLNREEYRNTIRDLTGVDYAVEDRFPADDTGYGFDTIGDVLNLSPIHVEKYLAAATEIVDKALKQNNPMAGNPLLSGPPPRDPKQRRDYLQSMLRPFADRAFRRPVDERTLEKLTNLASNEDTFEEGVRKGFAAILAAPRFLFRAETEPAAQGTGSSVLVDEYALASRLSYFLWSSLPDAELLRLASTGELRAQLSAQVQRMLKDWRSERFVRNFVGQWLQTRDAPNVPIQPRAVLDIKKGDPDDKLFSQPLREAMRRETEALFQHIMRQNLPAEELLTARYTFANKTLAAYYGVQGVKGHEMQKISLPAGSHRQGILSHGSFLVVTSNPTRTSPVKRGQFILENILGAPAPPPPPNIPPLESVKRTHQMSMRELMEIHRADPLCASCHQRMDPLGLALENFNAMGMYRETVGNAPVDVSGKLITSEKFSSYEELVGILATSRKHDFYRCLAEKTLTYALGRGLNASDIPNISQLVTRIEAHQGRLADLVLAVVESTPFQKTRVQGRK